MNANEVVADCSDLAAPLGAPRGITIINQFSSGPISFLRTDKLRLNQIILNLLSNAVKYNKDGGTVTITGRETAAGFLHISVSDTGVGIAEENQSNVFQIFHRFGDSAMKAREGTGIGLAVTKMLVEQMAGQIGFVSERDVGSMFWIEMPLASNKEVLIWIESLRTGVDDIDRDHQYLISLLNTITQRSSDDAELHEDIKNLIDYSHRHFRREVTIMEACGYPGLKEHLASHHDLSAQLDDLAERWRKECGPKAHRQLCRVLRELLLAHISESDTDMARFAKGKRQVVRSALEHLE